MQLSYAEREEAWQKQLMSLHTNKGQYMFYVVDMARESGKNVRVSLKSGSR